MEMRGLTRGTAIAVGHARRGLIAVLRAKSIRLDRVIGLYIKHANQCSRQPWGCTEIVVDVCLYTSI